MNTWKSKLFGDNNLNFYGWILGGMFVIFGSLFVAITAVQQHSIILMLLAIYAVLIGILCVQLTNYHARVAEKLDENSDAE